MVPPEESLGYRNVSGSVRMVGNPEVGGRQRPVPASSRLVATYLLPPDFISMLPSGSSGLADLILLFHLAFIAFALMAECWCLDALR